MLERIREKLWPAREKGPQFDHLQREALLSHADDVIAKLEHLEGELLPVASGHMPPLSTRTGQIIDSMQEMRRRIARLEA